MGQTKSLLGQNEEPPAVVSFVSIEESCAPNEECGQPSTKEDGSNNGRPLEAIPGY